jgi:hypothetical protein
MNRPFSIPKKPRAIARQLEHAEQMTLCGWLRAKRIIFFAVPNGARRNPRQAAWLKAEGLTAGSPDIIIVPPVLSDGWKHVAVEMKRADGGYLSPSQKEMHEAMRGRGWIVCVAHGAMDAIKQLTELGY